MATNYPGSLDTSTQQPSPSASTEMDDAGFEHDAVHTNHSGAIIALETKVGTGSSTAVANSVLAGTGSGTSSWTTTPTVTGLTVNGDTSSTGHFTAQSGGADSGIVLGQAFSSSYVGLRTAGMAEASNDEYVLISDGSITLLSAGTGGDVYIRGGANNSSCQILLDTSANQITFTGIVTTTDEIRVGSGSASDPALTFSGDSNTGFYVTGNNGRIHFTGNGTEGGYLLSTGGRFVNGSASSPSYGFRDDTDTGMYRVSTNQVGFTTGGTLRARFYSGGFLMGSAGTGNAQISTGSGSASAPTYHFYGDTNTGMYRNTADQLSLTTGGTVGLIAAAGTVNTAGLSTSSTSGYQYVMRNTTFGTLYRYTSSADVKENITNVTASDAGAWMDALQPVTFNERWLQEGTESDEDRAFREADIQVGFVADDVLANSTTAKFAQVENVDGTLKGVGWKWECVIAAAVAEIKSLRTRVADLEAA